MVQGLLSIAGSAERTVSSQLDCMKATIAQAANALQSAVHMTVKKGQGNGKSAEVGFSIEVERGQDAASMVNRLTDPTLVSSIAEALKVDASHVSMEAKAKALDEVLLSLSWMYPKRISTSSPQGSSTDYLDGSCLVYAEEKLLEVVDYRGPQSLSANADKNSSACGWSAGKGGSAAIVHSGDVMTETGGNHVLRLRLSLLPPEVTDCVFTLSAYYSRDLSAFIQPRMRLFDADCPEHLLSGYSISDAGSASAAVVCSLTREADEWTVRALSLSGDGTVRDYAPIERNIALAQVRYGNRRRRYPYVRLYELWQDDRVLPCSALGENEDVLLPLFDLNSEVFRHIMEFV
eukprot:TRINITY_DN9967_c0_g1_i1.p1 TRINITY_DN9967_c0_g1~~TRINITY_DN9967_c0_g1_i1.p1  ORF type:complete len:348 (-),score=45.50 TRINITY_DN9967_c0_g1_i1:120-1163(-)